MKHPIARLGLVGVVALTFGCDSQEAAPAADDTTAALLGAGAVSDGQSTPVPLGGPMENGPRVGVSELGYNLGDSAAIVKVVEMSDFGCGYCRRFHDETFPTLREQFVESGMVEWKFIPYITGMFDNSLAATEASECVMEQDAAAYEAIAGRLWSQQADWKGAAEPEALLREWVTALDVDMSRFDECVADDRRVQRIASATTLARQLGVRGTPTFVVIGYGPLQGALPLEVFQEVFTVVHQQELEQRGGADSGQP